MAHLIAACLVIGILISGYLLSQWRREKLLQREIEALELEQARASEEG